MSHSWTGVSQWRGVNMTLFKDGVLCCSTRSRAEICEEQKSQSVEALPSKSSSPSASASTVLIKLTRALCVRCSPGVAYGKRPYAFVVKARHRDYFFAVSSVEAAGQWVDTISNAIAALDRSGEARSRTRSGGSCRDTGVGPGEGWRRDPPCHRQRIR